MKDFPPLVLLLHHLLRPFLLKSQFAFSVLFILFAFDGFGQFLDWELLNPRPTYRNFNELAFVDQDRGFASTEDHTYATMDGGDTWVERQDLPGSISIDFFGDTGILLNSTWNGNAIYRSVDGGETWTPLDLSIQGTFRRVQFLSASTVVLLTSEELITSGNTGDSWFVSELPETFIVDGFFHSDGTGVIASSLGKIYSTGDSGLSWEVRYEIDSSNWNDFFTVEFVTPELGFATSEGWDEGILKTTDGGMTWEETATEVFSEIYDIQFVNETTGFMAGEFGKFYRTDDAGDSWQEITSSTFILNPSYTIRSLYAHDENTISAVGFGGRISRSFDGGATWVFNSNLFLEIRDMFHLNEDVVYAVSRNSLYKSTDGGHSWNLQSELPDADYGSAREIIFLNENVGYLTRNSFYSGYYYKTEDGGVTWEDVDDPNSFLETVPYIGYYHPDTLYTSTGYSSTGNPSSAFATYRIVDDGFTWELIYPNTIYDISFVSGHHFYGIENDSGDRRILKTTDAGDSWETLLEVQDTILRKLSFPSAQVGYCLAEADYYDQGVFKTSNGGEDWQFLNFPSSNYVGQYQELVFIDELHGYIAGEDGILLSTSDGGETWITNWSFYGYRNMNVFGNHLYISGSGGVIMRYALPTLLSAETQTRTSTEWTIYPNPSDGWVNLNLPNSNFEGWIHVFDVRGKLVEQVRAPGGQEILQLDMHSKASGMYFIRLQSDELRDTKMLLLD